MVEAIITAAVIALVVVGIVLLVRWARRRPDRAAVMTAYAERQGWTYHAAEDELAEEFDVHPFEKNIPQRRWVRNVVRGSVGARPATVLDYGYRWSLHGKSGVDHFTVVLRPVGAVPLAMSVRDTSPLHTGMIKPDLETGDRRFDRAFKVTADSPDLAGGILTPQVTEASLRWPDLSWCLEGESLLVVTRGRAKPDRIDDMLEAAEALTTALPQHLRGRLEDGE